jgi:two-component system, LytTR family, response regulator
VEQKLRVLIADDEPLARDKVRRYLTAEADIEIVGEAASGHETLDLVDRLSPDLLFLDIQMPGMDGLTLLSTSRDRQFPFVIFLTAYEQHAVQAFELEALDYLLKPYDEDRFAKSLERARKALKQMPGTRATDASASAPYLERLLVKEHGRLIPVHIQDVDHLSSAGNYVRLHCGTTSYLIRDTLTRLESALDPKQFIRIHRTAIVNIQRIHSLESLYGGDYTIKLTTGAKLTLSRNYTEHVMHLLGR